MTPWSCSRCGEDQVAFGRLPADLLCHTCHDAQHIGFSEAAAGIPERYRGLTRESWATHFQRPWPAALERWTGCPHWVALWGPTGTGKTGHRDDCARRAPAHRPPRSMDLRPGARVAHPVRLHRCRGRDRAPSGHIAPRPRRAALRPCGRLVRRTPRAHHPQPRRQGAAHPDHQPAPPRATPQPERRNAAAAALALALRTPHPR